jgi:transposase
MVSCKRSKSQEGRSGRAAWDPRLLLSVWLYAYSEHVTSAREIEELMEYEPGLMWLAGLGEVNRYTLSDFRAEHPEELKKAPIAVSVSFESNVVLRMPNRGTRYPYGLARKR